jgi:hypothetical protein
MRSEIIQLVACDNYDDFPHLSFIFSQKLISLFNVKTDPRVKYTAFGGPRE